MYTNCITKLENDVLLQEAIIRLGDIRAELATYNQMLGIENDPGTFWDTPYYTHRYEAEILTQVKKEEILERINRLEKEKYELDALIAKANNTVDTLDSIPQ